MFRVLCVDGQISEIQLIDRDRDWRLEIKMLGEENIIFNRKIEKTIPICGVTMDKTSLRS